MVRFLVDRCAGRRLTEWLRQQGHDVRDARDERPDPGDAALLQIAAEEQRVLVTIDTDFGALKTLSQPASCSPLWVAAGTSTARLRG